MDGQHFDELVRSISRSRRVLLGLGTALGLTPLLGDAKKRKKKKRKKPPVCSSCPACQQCQGSACVAVANGATCGAGSICDGGACRALRCGDPGMDCAVFISSTLHSGNLGGLAGADAICQNLANAAGIPGQFMAWLSDSSASPSTRFPTKATGAYRLLNGVKIADNWADLTDGRLDALIYLPDTGYEGESGPGQYTWTGTRADGQGSSTHCNNWTNDTGGVMGTAGYHRRAVSTDNGWTMYVSPTCNVQCRLYCFQQA